MSTLKEYPDIASKGLYDFGKCAVKLDEEVLATATEKYQGVARNTIVQDEYEFLNLFVD